VVHHALGVSPRVGGASDRHPHEVIVEVADDEDVGFLGRKLLVIVKGRHSNAVE
jgi:hypothetical protein